MANQIRYQVGFDIQKTNLNQLKSSLQELQKMKISDIVKINQTDIASARDVLKSIQQDAGKVENALNKAFNTKLNTINIQVFNKELSSANLTIEQVYRSFSRAGASGEAAFRILSTQILSTNIQLKESHAILDKMATTLANSLKWNAASAAVNGLSRSVEQAWSFVKSLDTSLNDIRIVTGKSADEMANFAVQANNAAKELGKTTTDYTNAALIYAQQGLNDKEIAERTAITLKTANVTGQSADAVSEQLTSVWNGYKVNAEEAELYVDRLAAVAATTASDLEELSTGMSKVASAAAAMGVGEDQLAAQLSTIISVTRQAPESVGTALRTVYARISDIQAGIDEDGVTLGNYSGKMAELGFNVLDATGHLRDMGEVMEEIGGRWQELTREQQVSLAQTMAGQRQYSNLIALFDNFEQYNKALATAQNAAGTLQEQQDIYMESTRAHLEQLTASIEKIYNSLADTDSINGLIDGLSEAATFVSQLVDSLGGGKAVLSSLGTLGFSVFSQQIANGIQTTINNLENARDQAQRFKDAIQQAEELQKKGLGNEYTQFLQREQSALLNMGSKLPVKDFNAIQQKLQQLSQTSGDIEILEQKIELLGKSFNSLGTDVDKAASQWGTLDDMLSSADGVETIKNALNNLKENFNPIIEKQQQVREAFKTMYINIENDSPKAEQSFNNLKIAMLDLINSFKTTTLGDSTNSLFSALPENARKSVLKAKFELQKLDFSQIGNPQQASTKITQIFANLNQSITNEINTIRQLIKSADEGQLEGLQEKLRHLLNLQKQVEDEYDHLRTKAEKSISMQQFTSIASGIAQVGSSIRQIQNLGSIWKNTDLSLNDKILQTVTNLAISLPMLVTGFMKVSKAMDLVSISTEAVQGKIRLLGTSLQVNPWFLVATAILGVVTALGTYVEAVNKAREARIKQNQSIIDQENAHQQEIQSTQQLLSALQELDQQREDGEISRSELKSSIQDLIHQYGLEGQAADNLAHSYDNLAEYIHKTRKEAAGEAKDSAKRQLKAAKKVVEDTAAQQGREGHIVGSEDFSEAAKYSRSQFMGGIKAPTENEALVQLFKNTGLINEQGVLSIDLNTKNANDVLSTYEQLEKILTQIDELQESGVISQEELNDSQLYNTVFDLLQQLKPAVQAYKTAKNDFDKADFDFSIEDLVEKDIINFSSNIKNLKDYIEQRSKLIKQLRENEDFKDLTDEQIESKADSWLSDRYRSLYNQYSEATDFIEKTREQLGGENSVVEQAIGELDPQHFNALMDQIEVHPSILNSWDTLLTTIQNIAGLDLSNIQPATNGDVSGLRAAATQKYNAYETLKSNVQGGKNISEEDFSSLDPEVQEYFSLMTDGTYKMTGDAQKFYELINGLELSAFEETIGKIQDRIQKNQELQKANFDYDDLTKSSASKPQLSPWNFLQKQNQPKELFDYDLAQKQLNYLKLASDLTQDQVKNYQDMIDNQTLSFTAAENLAKQVQNVGDKTRIAKEEQEAQNTQLEKTQQQMSSIESAEIDKEIAALKMSREQLKQWAQNRGMVFDETSKQDWEQAINTKQIINDADALKSLASNFVDENGKIKEGINTSSDAFVQLQTQLETITGRNWTSNAVINMIEQIAAWTDDGTQKFQTYIEYLDYIKTNRSEQVSQKTAVDTYKEDKADLDNLKGAASSLEKHTELSQDQSQALAQAASIDQQLAAILNNENATSEQILQVVNQIIEAKERELQISKQQALQENADKLEAARKELEVLQSNAGSEADERKKQLQEIIISLLQQRIGLEQDLSQIEDKPKFDEDVDVQTLEHLSETIQQIAPESEELANTLAEDEGAADDLAQAILRFDDACVDVSKNYDDWMDALNSGSLQEQVQAMDGLRDAYADLLDLDGSTLSNDFLTNTENLDLMKAAIDGDTDAYDELMSRAGQDIITHLQLSPEDYTQFQTDLANVQAMMDEMNFQDIEIGASLDDANFIAGLENMINAAGMTAQQATDYLASMGVDAEVIEQKTEGTETKQVTGYHGEANNTQIPYDFVYMNGTSLEHYTGSITAPGVNYVPDTETVTDTKENSAFSLKVTSAHKSSGGNFKFSQAKNGGGSKGASRRSGGSGGKGRGGGKGGKGGGSGKAAEPDKSQKDRKKAMEDERDIYHDINIELEQINRRLDRTQKKQDRLYGKQLLDNLNKQSRILDQHKAKLEEKHDLQEQDLIAQQKTLKNLGVTFDKYGNIANYMDILGNKQAQVNAKTKEYNSLIDAYNKSTDKDIKKQIAEEAEKLNKQIAQYEDEYKDLEDKIKNYDGLREDMEDLVDQIEEETQKQIEINIKKFRMEIEIRLDMGEAERDWNKFRREVLEHTDIIKDTNFQEIFSDAAQGVRDITSYFNVHGSKGSLQTLTEQLMDTRAEIEAINKTGSSAIYGDNKAQAMEDLQNDLKKLMEQMEDIQGLIDDVDKAYLDTIGDIGEQFDKQIDDYEYIGELIEHDIDLLSLIYGDKNYDAMNKYYEILEKNNLKQLDSLKQQRDFWKEQWDAAVARGDTQAAKQFEENYKETIKNLNETIEEAAKNIQSKYINAIDKIFDELDKKISNGKGTDYLNTEWELMNKNADEYLDTINTAFAIQETERKYQKALDETKSIKNQQALKKLMNEQLGILKNKEKVTQYDVDRAEKLLQVEQARIALQDAQSAKTSMRLKRDSQGNYSYEYVADNGAVDDAQANLAQAQNDLYNFDKDRYKSNLDDMLSAWKDFQSDYKDILEDTSLTEQDRIEKLALLREQYGQYINDKTAENLVVRNNLMESAFADLAALYNTDVENYNQMSIDEQNILMGDLVPAWESGIQQMADKVAGEGGFIPVCEEAFENITEKTKDYEEQLDNMANAAGVSLDYITQGVNLLSDTFENLIENNDELIDRMSTEVDSIQTLRDAASELVSEYRNVYNEAKSAVSEIHNFIQEEQKRAAAYVSTANVAIESYNRTAKAYSDAYDKMASSFENYAARVRSAASGNSSGGSGGSGGSSGGSDGSGGSSGGSGGGGSSSRTGSQSGTHVSTTWQNGKATQVNWRRDKNGNIIRLASGGYTGDWHSSEGRIAVLHQKQLVLNESDTKNILDSVSILRSMSDNVLGSIRNRNSNLNLANQSYLSSENGVEQNVHIEASFPNVDSKREIEEAFNDLVNLAAQRAMRR